jgi:hypothetical protein
MCAMRGHGFWGRGTQRHHGQEEQRRKEHEASSREEKTLRNDQRTTLQCRSDREKSQAKDRASDSNHNNTINTIKNITKKRADVVYSDANHLAPRSKKPRMKTAKGEEAGIRNPGGVEVVQNAYKDDEDADQVNSAGNFDTRMCWSSTGVVGSFQPTFPSDEHSRTGTDRDSLLRENLMVDSSSTSSTQTSSLPTQLLSSPVEKGEFQAATERLKQGFDRSLFQPCSKGDTAADARIQELEQEIHILEEELKNKDETPYANAVHKMTLEATASANGANRARWTTIVWWFYQGYCGPSYCHTHPTCFLSVMLPLLKKKKKKKKTRMEVSTKRVSLMNMVRQLTPPIEMGTQTPVKLPRLSFRSAVK